MKEPAYPRFQAWLLERMVDQGYTPMSLAVVLGALDGDVESWVAGRSLPTLLERQKLAQLFEVPVQSIHILAGNQ